VLFEVFEVGAGDQLVKIADALLLLYDNNYMLGLPARAGACRRVILDAEPDHERIYLRHAAGPHFFEPLEKLVKQLRPVAASSTALWCWNSGNQDGRRAVKGVLLQIGQQVLRKDERVYRGAVKGAA
jgi:hypothetical protein